MNKTSILAGIFISIGCIVNLSVGGGILGAILFTVGLLGVVGWKAYLFTGKAGFDRNYGSLTLGLLGNVLGCMIMALLFRDNTESALGIVQTRLASGPILCGIKAIGCGILMTTAVKLKGVSLLYCVPVFIMAGFYHCIADAFYYLEAGFWDLEILWCWITTVLGNWIGCNIPIWFSPSEKA